MPPTTRSYRGQRVFIGGGLYLTAVGLLGFGIGALVRHTAGTLHGARIWTGHGILAHNLVKITALAR